MASQPEATDITTAPSHSMLHQFHHNVKAYGAVADGVTNDAAAITAAVTAASAGGIIFFPPGTYAVSSMLSITPPSGKSISFIGAGSRTTTLKRIGSVGATDAIIDMSAGGVSTQDNIGGRIEGLTFDGNAKVQDCLRLTDLARTDVIDCQFGGATRAGIRGASGGVGSGWLLAGIIGCHFGQPTASAYGVDLNGCHNITVERCEFYNETTTSLLITGGDGNRVINSDFEGLTIDGTYSIVVNAPRTTIAFNRFEDVTAAHTNSRSILWKTGQSNLTVMGNDFGELGAAVYTMGLETGCSGLLCVGNHWAVAPSGGCLNMGGFSTTSSIIAVGEMNGSAAYFANDTFVKGSEIYCGSSSMRGLGARVTVNRGTTDPAGTFDILGQDGLETLLVTLGSGQNNDLQRWRDNSANTLLAVVKDGTVQFTEHADPAAGAANTARLYCKDNGAGKTQLVVRFNTGAVQVIATEP